MLAAPLIEPRIVGVKKRLALHEPPAATLPLQLSVSVKSPLIVITIGCADAPVLVIVTAFAPLVVVINCFAKVMLAGETVSCPHEFTAAIVNKAESNRTLCSCLAREFTEVVAARAVIRIGSLRRRAIDFFFFLFSRRSGRKEARDET